MRPLPEWYEKFREMKNYGMVEKVEGLINEKLKTGGPDPFLYDLLGDIYLEKKELKKAEELYRNAKEMFIKQGEYTRAVAMLHKERMAHPDKSIEKIIEFGDLLWKAGLKRRTKQYYINTLKDLASQNRMEEVEKILNVLASLFPDNLDLKIIMSKILMMNGKRNDAKRIIVEELKKAEQKRDIGAIEKLNEVLDTLEENNE